MATPLQTTVRLTRILSLTRAVLTLSLSLSFALAHLHQPLATEKKTRQRETDGKASAEFAIVTVQRISVKT